ncbi:MAG TPA: DUF5719 family protein [Actinospica sp.]|nr:DUF5719 family protein [Actinospica sp.]
MNDKVKQSKLGPVAGVGRRVQVAGVVIGALVVGLGYGLAKPAVAPAASASSSAAQSTTTPVSSATVVCPMVKDSNSTDVSTFTPNTVPVSGSAAETVGQLQGGKSLLTAGKPGTLASAINVSGASASAQDISNPVVAKASGPDAAGFTVTETVPSGSLDSDKGLASENCGSPDTDFWFVGLGTDSSPFAMLNLANVESVAATVTITMYTAGGEIGQSQAQSLQGITVPANSEQDELVNVLDTQSLGAPYAIHVVASAGRVGAAVLDWDGKGGGRDFVGAQKSASKLVIPGIPQAENQEKVQLSLLSPDTAASVALRWVGHSTINPAQTGQFSGNLVQGKVSTVDLSTVPTAGEYAALEVCGANSAANQCLPVTGSAGAIPIVGGIKITQTGGGQDTAYTEPVQPLAGDGIVADDQPGSVLTLTNTGSSAAQVKLTETGTGAGPATSSSTVSVPAGQTVSSALTAPKGASDFALTVTPLSGAPDVYAARIEGTGSKISIQPLSSAAETVTIPAVGQDASGLVPQN